MTNATVSRGFYVNLEKTPEGNLAIHLTAEGQKEFPTIEAERDARGINAALHLLLEDHLASGWDYVAPEDIGALTAAPILSDNVLWDDAGDVAAVERVYWYPDYQIHDEIEELREKLVIMFQGVS